MPDIGRFARVNGLNMYYEIRGDGRPLVLLHGGLLTIDLAFGAMLPSLSAGRRTIGVELQGHGHTADIDRPMSLDLLADDVAGLLDTLAIDRADVLGFSLGGLVATQLAIDHPDRVDRLVLVSTHFRPDGYHDDVRDPALAAGSTRLPTSADFDAMRRAYRQVAPDPAHFNEFVGKTSAAVAAFTGWSERDLAAITAPTLFLVGDSDFVRREHAVEFSSHIAGSQLAMLPNTTHMQVCGRVDLVVPMVERFLDEGR